MMRIYSYLKKLIKRNYYRRDHYLLSKSLFPISDIYGFDRGNPVDRFYIENFLRENHKFIKGACLELLDNNYTVKFGKDRVGRSDILDIDKKNKKATIYGDLRNLRGVRSSTYDCIILTQTLQFIDDFFCAVAECKRILKEHGTLLVTLPSISRIDCVAGIKGDYWRFTEASAKYIFSKFFRKKDFRIKPYGNVLAGIYFWVGLSQEELTKKELNFLDRNFPCIIGVRAIKS